MKALLIIVGVVFTVGVVMGFSIGNHYGEVNAWPVAQAMAAQTTTDQAWLEARFSQTGELAETCRTFILEAMNLLD